MTIQIGEIARSLLFTARSHGLTVGRSRPQYSNRGARAMRRKSHPLFRRSRHTGLLTRSHNEITAGVAQVDTGEHLGRSGSIRALDTFEWPTNRDLSVNS